MTADGPLLSLQIEKSEVLLDGEDPYDFLYESHGWIVGIGDRDRCIRIGRFRVFQVDIANGLEADLSAHDVLDGSSETFELTPLFKARGSQFSASVEKLCQEELMGLNLLVIDRVEILPPYRGSGYGAQVVKGLIRRFGAGASLAALKVFPLQLERGYPTDAKVEAWRRKMDFDALPQDEAKARQSLKKFYTRLGFMAVPRTDLMIANLAWRLP